MSISTPIVRETAAVTVTDTVDGTRRRRTPVARRRLAITTVEVTVDPRIMAAARAALRPGERLLVNPDGTVRTAYL